MKRFIIIIFFSIILHIGSFAQSNSLGNPVYLGMILIDLPSVEKMINVCESYNLEELPDLDGYKVYRHPNGTEFRFKGDKANSLYKPTVVVATKENQKSIDHIMQDAGYTKENGGYCKGTRFERRRTKCRVSGGIHKTLTFEKEYNSL